MGIEQGGIPFPFIMIAIFLIFYFLVIRPEKQKQKDQQNARNNLKKNDRVITTGGIYGTIVNVKDTSIIVRVDDSTKMEFDKQSVTPLSDKKKEVTKNCPLK